MNFQLTAQSVMAAVVTVDQSQTAKSRSCICISSATPIRSVRTGQLTGQLTELAYK